MNKMILRQLDYELVQTLLCQTATVHSNRKLEFQKEKALCYQMIKIEFKIIEWGEG